MKKLVLFSFVIFAFSSCKKNDEKITDEPENTTEEITSIPAEETSVYPVVSSNQLAEILKAKPDNDTLYITNFFATWCQPCMIEIPHFKEAMKEMEGEKVKFTFVDVDQKSDWETKVKAFGDENQLGDHIVLYDMANGPSDFMSKHTATWDGNAIPFTRISKGRMTNEMLGAMLKKEDLDNFLETIK